jgi:tetratricopeptide (TPR) repeat protein
VLEPNRLLRAARERVRSPRLPNAHLSRAELAEAVNAWLHEHTKRSGAFDGHYVGRLERGVVRWPGNDYRAALRAVLGVDNDDALGFRPPRGHLVSPCATGLDPAGALDEEAGDRLNFAVPCPRRADGAAVDAMAAVLGSVRRLEDETSAADVLPTVLHQRKLIERIATGARDGVRSRAVALSSEISQYLGWLSMPLERWEDSRRYLDRSAVLALEVDDPDRLSAALSFQAYSALRRGDFVRADAISEAARRDTRAGIGLRTYETYQRAEVLARLGDRQAAARLLLEADRMVEHLPPPEDLPDAGYWYIPAFFLGQRGFVLRALGDLQGAREAGRACLDTMPAEWAESEWAERRRRLAEE